eukprot:COSAG05_NODE_1567_length_4534_cov_4.122886_6_plen_103_part_01
MPLASRWGTQVEYTEVCAQVSLAAAPRLVRLDVSQNNFGGAELDKVQHSPAFFCRHLPSLADSLSLFFSHIHARTHTHTLSLSFSLSVCVCVCVCVYVREKER